MRRSLCSAIAAILLCPSIPAHADVTISAAQTQGITCSGGVCAPTATTAVLNVGDLETLLASGDVEVTTTGSGVQAGNIDVDAPLSWSGTNTLALDAYDSVAVSKPVSVAGTGGLAVTTNDGGSGGTLSFGSKGHVTFQNLSSPLTINGTPYTLANSVATLASAVLANPGGAFALASNYNAAQDGTYSSSPIGTDLEGTIEGLGNTISNLSIDAKRGHHAAAELLWGVDATGTIENLRLRAIHYTGVAIGGLASGNDGYLFGDVVAGSMDSRRDSAGGLVGWNQGTIVSSSSNVRIKVGCCKNGEGFAGGLVYYNQGTIELSHAGGDVSGPLGAGGLVANNEGTISESYATGNVVYGEGLVAVDQTDGTISNSYATGSVGGSGYGAGFLGKIGIGTTGTITDSYSTGAVSAGDGGFACGGDALMFGNKHREAATGGTDYFTDDYWDTKTSVLIPIDTAHDSEMMPPGIPR